MVFLDNLKQRKLVQWTLAYLAGAWFVMQLLDVVGGRWGVSNALARVIDLLLVLGFFITLVVAWYHGEQGRQRVSGPELLIIAALLVACGVGLSALNSGAGRDIVAESATAVASVVPLTSTEQAPWIAVLPFKEQNGDVELINLADGLTEDITSGLSAFSYLLVLSRNAIEHIEPGAMNIRQIGRELEASYVMQGTVRKVGDTVRIGVQLVDGKTGTNVWAETFDHSALDTATLALQDRITDEVVATVADPYGVVARTLAAPTDSISPEAMTPYEAVLRWFLYQQRISPADHRITRTALERATSLEPGYADAWACLSNIYLQEFMQGFPGEPNPRDRALEAAQRAMTADPTSQLANYTLAQTYYFKQDLGAFRAATERTIRLNSRDSNSMAMLGILTGYGGDWERSVELTTAAMKLNPHHPGWYRFNIFFNAYRQENYAEALDIAQRINMPDYWADPLAQALAHGQLGNTKAARGAAQNLLDVWPRFETEYYEHGLKNWIYTQPELLDHIDDGLRKAGINLNVSRQ